MAEIDDVKLLLAQAHDVLTRSRYLMTLLGGQEHLIDWDAVDKLKVDIDGMIDRIEAGACRYPDCVDGNEDRRCTRWLTGECGGPKP